MIIPVIRSIPKSIPDSRAFVNDGYGEPQYQILHREISDNDYVDVFAELVIKEPIGFVILEWDIAIQQNHLAKFLKKCSKNPGIVHTVPYQILSGEEYVWVHTNADFSWVSTHTKYCAHFGFGCTYFPVDRVRQFRPNPIDPRVTDMNFSRWYYPIFGATPIHWDIPAVHLNV